MSEKITGQLYLIPSALGEESLASIPESTRSVLYGIQFFLVENERSARRFLRSAGYKKNFEEGVMIAVARDEDFIPPPSMLQHLLEGNHIGVISEAGCPGIADPGAAAVLWAHEHHIKVVPLTGPSSIFLALMASGLNGQQFAFHGYLPVNAGERKVKLKQLEEESLRKNQTQIFMETPYRNTAMLKDVLESCRPKTLLCIASGITLPSEKILTQSIHDWKKQIPDIHKKPTIFLILAKQ
ncbi:MAG TPA: SAM-dependent methyltransferase [Chitinophagales bacterium]|nr:SAM-dependent methyltransferase [Chitinophagales bacterium]